MDNDIRKGDDTFLDTLYQHLAINEYKKLKEIISDNAYDTESVNEDLEIFKTAQKSNLSQFLDENNNVTANKLIKVFEKAKSYFHIYSDLFKGASVLFSFELF